MLHLRLAVCQVPNMVVMGVFQYVFNQVDVLQAAFNNLESSMLALQAAPASGRSTAGLLGAAPAPASPRGGAAGVGVGSKGETGFAPVRPGRRGTALHDENEGVKAISKQDMHGENCTVCMPSDPGVCGCLLRPLICSSCVSCRHIMSWDQMGFERCCVHTHFQF